MTEQSKSLIRHILTALGMILVALGLGKYSGVIDFALGNLDGVWQSISVIIGFVTTLFGFFKDSTRFSSKR